MSLAIGAYFFLIAFFLAHLEIQIEGPHGWAEKLPTWRWDGPGGRRWLGKPVTGYHVCLVTLILLCVHLPQLYAGSWEREADLLAMFFLLTVTWDFPLVRVQPPLRRGPVPQGPDLVVLHLDARRPPALSIADRALPLRRARAGALDGDVGGPCPALEHGLLRAARPDGHRDRFHPPSAAAGAGSSTRGPKLGEGQARVVRLFGTSSPRPRAGEEPASAPTTGGASAETCGRVPLGRCSPTRPCR
jgi:hypothetical protein